MSRSTLTSDTAFSGFASTSKATFVDSSFPDFLGAHRSPRLSASMGTSDIDLAPMTTEFDDSRHSRLIAKRSRRDFQFDLSDLFGESILDALPNDISTAIKTVDSVTGQSAQISWLAGLETRSLSQGMRNDTLLSPEDLTATEKSRLSLLRSPQMRGRDDRISASSQYIIHQMVGTLGADTFHASASAKYTVVSGNGNVFYGNGGYDYLDLSTINSSSVMFNLVGMTGDGVLYNPGNGARVFDMLTLSNGNSILIEGIDRVYFQDGWLNLAETPNDPMFFDQWNLHMMNVHTAWRFTTGSAEDVLIGVQDTGMGINMGGYTHEDLRTTYIYPDNYADESLDLSHGTAVQSIIAATSDNGIGMSGINWNSDVFNIDVLGGELNDWSLTDATAAMINFAAERGQKLVINMSLGADTGGGIGLEPGLEELIAAYEDEVLFVIATGNDDQSYLSYPANLANLYDNVIAVGASWGAYDQYGYPKNPGERISYPGWWGSNYGYGLGLMGPSEVVAAESYPSYFGAEFDYVYQFNGTSAATPNVAGVASLVWSVNPDLTADEVYKILAKTAYDLDYPGYDLLYGNGFINADAAVRMAIATVW